MSTVQQIGHAAWEIEHQIAEHAKHLAQKALLWRRNLHTRRHLEELPEYLLRDIGIDRHDVEEELKKPFWR